MNPNIADVNRHLIYAIMSRISDRKFKFIFFLTLTLSLITFLLASLIHSRTLLRSTLESTGSARRS